MWWRRLVVCIAFAGCTKSNPARDCTDGSCSDPAFPFCDISGSIRGEAGTCVAGACTADAFLECRGDIEVRCNVDGTNYNLAQCDRGCSTDSDGCRLCDPGETACTNGKVATCDAAGTVVSATECPLGCFENEPRCRDVDPSNGLGMYFDMAPDAPVLEIENGTFNTSTGTLTDNGAAISVPSFLVAAPNNGVAVRVFVVASAAITQARVVTADFAPGPALALISLGDVRLNGALTVQSTVGSAEPLAACAAGNGFLSNSCGRASSGGGGGGYGTNGARGGAVMNIDAGGAAGIANGNERIVPLRGGCAGGAVSDSSGELVIYGDTSGGAVQIVSRTRILIDGIVNVSGTPGDVATVEDQVGNVLSYILRGGGSGGAILLEAPAVVLDVNAQLAALGGDGSDVCGVSGVHCTTRGTAAAPGVAATPGEDSPTCNSNGPAVSGSGGGGMGRIRINTADGTYVKASSAVEDGVLTAGTLGTR